MGAQDRRVVGEGRLDPDEIGERLALERRQHGAQPLDPLGMPGRVHVEKAIGMGEERGGHGARLGVAPGAIQTQSKGIEGRGALIPAGASICWRRQRGGTSMTTAMTPEAPR